MDRLGLVEKDSEGNPFDSAYRRRLIANASMQEAIYRHRVVRSGHSHPGARRLEDVPPGTEIEIFGKDPTRPKDIPGWGSPAVVVQNQDPLKVVFRKDGKLNDVPFHLIRPTP